MLDESTGRYYLVDAITTFRAYKKLAERALEQLFDEEYFISLDEESNSIAVIMKHLAGNMQSRWTDFLTTDGEKPERNRDMEFIIEPQTSRSEVMEYWEKGWQSTFASLESLQPEDLLRTVMIRGEKHAVLEAINRQLAHYSSHIGQIVFLAKHFRSTEWRSLSIPKNRSAEFNKYLAQNPNQGEHRFEAASRFNDDAPKDNLSAGIVSFHHVNVTVPRALEPAAKEFYSAKLGLEEVPKPGASRGRGGAWYQLSGVQLHLSLEDGLEERSSTRHVCFVVEDLYRAREYLEYAGVEILADARPVPGTQRFYVRDPGGNLIEIAERKID